MNTRSDNDAAGVWSDVSARLKDTLSESTWSTWFAGVSPVGMDAESIEVSVPNEFARQWIEGHFSALVTAAVRDATGAPLDVRFRVDAPVAARDRADVGQGPAPVPAAPAAAHGVRVPDAAHPLTGKYTFDHFVIGSSNRFAHAAALAVAEAPAQAYNPLFIYGATGLGKTHLLQAISHYLATETSTLRARYLTGEAFMNDFIAHLQDKRLDEFKTRYRTYDVLLIDELLCFFSDQKLARVADAHLLPL